MYILRELHLNIILCMHSKITASKSEFFKRELQLSLTKFKESFHLGNYIERVMKGTF